MLAVAVSPDCGGEGVGGGSLGLCLWAKISTGPWMVQSNLIKKLNLLAVKVVCKKKKGGGSSPALAVTPSCECRGGSMGSGGLGLCLWAETSTGPWIN